MLEVTLPSELPRYDMPKSGVDLFVAELSVPVLVKQCYSTLGIFLLNLGRPTKGLHSLIEEASKLRNSKLDVPVFVVLRNQLYHDFPDFAVYLRSYVAHHYLFYLSASIINADKTTGLYGQRSLSHQYEYTSSEVLLPLELLLELCCVPGPEYLPLRIVQPQLHQVLAESTSFQLFAHQLFVLRLQQVQVAVVEILAFNQLPILQVLVVAGCSLRPLQLSRSDQGSSQLRKVFQGTLHLLSQLASHLRVGRLEGIEDIGYLEDVQEFLLVLYHGLFDLLTGKLLDLFELMTQVVYAGALYLPQLVPYFSSLEFALHDLRYVVQDEPVLLVAKLACLDLERLIASHEAPCRSRHGFLPEILVLMLR